MKNIEAMACRECRVQISKLAFSLLKDKKNCPSCGQETEWLSPESQNQQRERLGRETAREIADLKKMLNDDGLLALGVLNLLLDARVEVENLRIQVKMLNFQMEMKIASVLDVQKTAKAN